MKIAKNSFAVSMARNVRSVEHRLDDALAAAGDMLQNFAEGRRSARISAEVGQDALEHFTHCTHSLALARGALVRSHQAMAEAGLRMGMTWDDDGDPLEGKPPPGEKESPRNVREGRTIA